MGKTPATLQLGSKSPSVLVLETKLRQLGFFKAFPDENFDEQTRQGVIDFQRFAAITVDGIAGPQTWQTLFGGAVKTLTLPKRPNEQRSVPWGALFSVASILGFLVRMLAPRKGKK